MIKLFPSPSGSIRIHYCMYMHLQSCILYVYICCSSVLATVPVFASWLDSCRHQRGKEKKNPTDYQADLFEERVHRSCQEALKEKK